MQGRVRFATSRGNRGFTQGCQTTRSITGNKSRKLLGHAAETSGKRTLEVREDRESVKGQAQATLQASQMVECHQKDITLPPASHVRTEMSRTCNACKYAEVQRTVKSPACCVLWGFWDIGFSTFPACVRSEYKEANGGGGQIRRP
jgi:hypothetical protein